MSWVIDITAIIYIGAVLDELFLDNKPALSPLYRWLLTTPFRLLNAAIDWLRAKCDPDPTPEERIFMLELAWWWAFYWSATDNSNDKVARELFWSDAHGGSSLRMGVTVPDEIWKALYGDSGSFGSTLNREKIIKELRQ